LLSDVPGYPEYFYPALAMNSMEDISQFIYELGMLRRIRREGWRLAGVEPESVAAHSLRAAQIGYLLACMEGHTHPDEVVAMIVFHDIGECRIGDIHKMANRYVNGNEEAVVQEQCSKLGSSGDHILGLWRRFEIGDSDTGIIARDADLLEMAATAREYMAAGHETTEEWLDAIEKRLSTDSAWQVFKGLINTEPHTWWQGLKKL
jgi:putative hydrolase of HD superfamily